jgi:hypothetical protein
MAVTPTTLSDINELAKDYYTNVYVPMMNTEVPLKMQFERLENAVFTGRKWIFDTKNSVGGASANVGANKTLPTPSKGQYIHGEATLVRTYTRLALDNFAIEVTKQQSGSFRPALKETMEDRLAQHDMEVNRQLFCGGDGKLAVVTGGTTTIPIFLNTNMGVTNGGNGSRHIYVDDVLAFYDTTGVTLRGQQTVTAVNHTTQAVTLAGAVAGVIATDFATRATADTNNKLEGEALGLLASVTDSASTFENINPATFDKWKALRLNNGGALRDLTDGLALQAIETSRARSRKIPNLAIARPGVVLKYSETFLSIRRIMGQDMELKGGYKPVTGIQYAGGVIPVLDDPDCPDSRLFLINTEAFRMADLIGTGWFDGDGAQFSRITDKDGIEGYVRKYWQLITIQRDCNAVIEDLNDYASVDRVF